MPDRHDEMRALSRLAFSRFGQLRGWLDHD
jgi:hypothetical protein